MSRNKEDYEGFLLERVECGDYVITEIADLGPVCTSCGASSVAVRLRLGPFAPVIGICYGAGHCWHIEQISEQGSIAWRNFESRKIVIRGRGAGGVATKG